MRSKKDLKYPDGILPKRITNWIKRMDALLEKMPKDIYLNADGQLHAFQIYKDGSQFEACKRSEDITEANDSVIHTFPASCDGGDFW